MQPSKIYANLTRLPVASHKNLKSNKGLALTGSLFAQGPIGNLDRCIRLIRVCARPRPFWGTIAKDDPLNRAGIVVIFTDTPWHMAIMFCRAHALWVRATGCRMGPNVQYAHSRVFASFPFPLPTQAHIDAMQSENVQASDAAVIDAYGWPATLSDDDTLMALSALNLQRAQDEKRGIIHYIRPDIQCP